MIIAGIDYSMTCPCITVFRGNEWNMNDCSIHFLTTSKKLVINEKKLKSVLIPKWNQPSERYEFISDWALNLVKDSSLVTLEGYAFAGNGRVFEIAENAGLLKYKMWKNNILFQTIPPSKIKKYAVGKGNADKNMMYDKFVEETKVDYKSLFAFKKQKIDSPLSDIADSYWICKYGSEFPNDK